MTRSAIGAPITLRVDLHLSELIAALALIESHRRFAQDPDDVLALNLSIVMAGKASARTRIRQTITRLGTEHFDCGLSWDKRPDPQDEEQLINAATRSVQRAWAPR